MVACFGLTEGGYPLQRFPRSRLVERNNRLSAFDLYQKGCLRPGLKIGNCRIELRPHAISRASVFACPRCNATCYKLFEVDGTWMCRTCGKLDYSCRHEHRSIRGLARLLWLRRRIGAELRPFGSLPDRPSRRVRNFHSLVAEIGALEANLIAYLGSINSDLKRRIRSRKAKSQW